MTSSLRAQEIRIGSSQYSNIYFIYAVAIKRRKIIEN